MIDELDINEIEKIEKLFKVFTKDKVLYDIENNPFTRYFVYKIDDKIVACINYHIMYERSELIDINVIESEQNKKIASSLLEFMFKDLKLNNVKEITLEVRENNLNAIHLYKKYGFKEISVRKGYYHGVDGILMKKELI